MSITIENVRAERYEAGVPVDTPTPRLSWRFAGSALNWKQASYDLRISRTGASAAAAAAVVKEFHVDSEQSIFVSWPDAPLASRELATVQVRATGVDGSVTPWASLSVEAALLVPADWTAVPVTSSPSPKDKPKRPIVLCKTFTLPHVPASARLYITALGLYEAEINGQRVGDHVLAPGWQSYAYRLSYQTFDVASMLKSGENVITASVGEGWYAGRLGFGGGHCNIWGERIALIAQLEADGSIVAKTDSSWKWTTGSIITSEVYDGEVIDTTEKLGAWSPVDILALPNARLGSPQAPPMRRTQEVASAKIITTPSGKTVIDFGQNLVGWLRWNKQVDGTGKVVIRHAEVLENGELGTRPLRAVKASDTITLGGSTLNYEPKFTFHGFRYAEINGFPRDVELDDFTAVVVHSDMKRTGTFDSSHKLINQLYSNIVWGMRGNFLSVPTDCPQRDERLGWTGDLMVFAPTAAFLYDVGGVLNEWLVDVASEQLDFGDSCPPLYVPSVPTFNPDPRAKPPPMAIWSDVTAITPHDLYTAFGDIKVLKDQYESMTAWLDRGVERGPSGLWISTSFQLGDWLDPRAPPDDPANGQTNNILVADIFLVHATRLVAKISEIIGHADKAAKYTADAGRLLDALHAEYVTPNGRLMSDSQTAYTCALAFGLFKSPEQAAVWANRLDTLVRTGKFNVGTGFAGTPLILLALAKNGKLQTAYRMLQEGQNPSWLYPVTMGATTMWERWDSMLPNGSINPGEMTSFNHYAFGSVAAFLHSVVGGLSPTEPGWKSFLVHPRPGGTFTHAKTEYITSYGLASCHWELNEDKTKLRAKVVVPPNTTAEVKLGDTSRTVGSGEYAYEVEWKEESEWPPQPIRVPFMPAPDIQPL